MKKIFSLILSVVIVLFLGAKVHAAGPWEEVIGCGNDGFLVSNAAKFISQIRYINQFGPKHLNTCIKYNTIGAIEEDDNTSLSICPAAYMLPYNNSSTSDYDLRYGCCPVGFKYIYNPDGNTVPFCSARSNIDKAERSLVTECQTSGDEYRCPFYCGGSSYSCNPLAFISADQNDTTFFYPSTTSYVCNSPNCIYSSANQYNETNQGPYSLSDIQNKLLVCTVDGATFIDPTYTCLKGSWYLTSAINEWGGDLGIFLTCNNFVDKNEVTACLACYKDCPTANTCSYSSLGCIQTTQSGIVVRIFQIGLGVVGALAIARFIQAALLRQTADPSKIQESYDIITSIIIGIVVLLGSTVILRFIGVDILQMLPF